MELGGLFLFSPGDLVLCPLRFLFLISLVFSSCDDGCDAPCIFLCKAVGNLSSG